MDCRSPYAASKVAGEVLCAAFAQCFPISTVCGVLGAYPSALWLIRRREPDLPILTFRTDAAFWTQFLFALDILFVTAGLWAFGPVVGGD